MIACSAIVAVFASFPTVLKGITANGDFVTRREFTFQLSQREDDSNSKELTDSSAKDMASIMEERLIKAGVTSYEIKTSGDDLIKVAFTADDDSEYRQITTYLSFSGSFALLNRNDDVIVGSDFISGEAYLTNTSVNTFPTVIIPIEIKESAQTAWDDLIQWSRDNPISNTTTNDDGEEETKNSYEVYLIYNYIEGDTYQTLIDRNQFNEKILITLDNTSDDTLYYNSDKNSIAQVCGYQDSNGNGTADPAEIKTAFNQANFLLNLFTASALDYDVKVIKGLESGTEVWLKAAVEPIFDYGHIAMTSVLISVLIAILVIALILVFFYRLGALNAMATTLVSVFLAFGFMVLTGLEYNLLAVAGLALVALMTLISNVIYLSKLKDESYRGRTLKKANSEASKRSLLPIIDLHVVGAVIGLFCYILAGNAVHTFASIVLIGSLISVLISIFGIRGLMWLATNTTKLTGKYNLFGINNDDVPNHMQEEQQRFYGTYADKDFTKKAKPLSIVGLSLAVLSLAGVITMGALNSGNLFKTNQSAKIGSEILVTNVVNSDKDETSPLTQNYIEDLFENIKLYSENENPSDVHFTDEDKHATLSLYVDKITSFTVSTSETEEGSTLNSLATYYQITLNDLLDGDHVYAVIKDESYTESKMTLNQVFNDYFEEIDLNFDSSISNKLSLKTIESVPNKQAVDWTKVLIAMSIAVGVITLYMMLRYRLSRGLASIVYPIIISLIVLGIFALVGALGAALPANIAVGVPMATFFFYSLFIIFANKEREMVVEDKSKDNSFEHRQEISKRAIAIAATPIFSATIITLFVAVVLMSFGPALSSYLYIALIFGAAIALVATLYTLVNFSNVLYKAFSNIKIDRPEKRKKGKTAPKQKSAEPEEAIFIGIND